MSLLDEHIKTQRLPWVSIGVVGSIGAGVLGYGLWYVARRHGSPRLEDLAPIAIGLVVAAFAVWIYTSNRRALADLHRFLARPANDVAWLYVHVYRDRRTLTLGAVDGKQTAIELNRNNSFAPPSDTEVDAVLREAAQRYPHATVGFSLDLVARFASNPRQLLRA